MEYKLSELEFLLIENSHLKIDLLKYKVNSILHDFYEKNDIKSSDIINIDFPTGIITVKEKEKKDGSNQ